MTIINDFALQVRRIAHRAAGLSGVKDERILMYDQIDAYCANNGLYQPGIYKNYYEDQWSENMRGLRTCANRVVEFYVAKLEPGAMPKSMPIVCETKKVADAISQILLWSNFSTKKSLILRKYAKYGDIFIETVVDSLNTEIEVLDDQSVDEHNPAPLISIMNPDEKRVRHLFHEPRYVSYFIEDENSNIIELRLDIPKGGLKYYTEIWDAAGVRAWNHDLGAAANVSLLGTPEKSMAMEEMGIDFIPIAHAKFRDSGDKFGVGAFMHALDKIDEANRMATRLHEMLFRYNKPLWVAMANSVDSQGKPLPPPRFSDTTEVTIEDDSIIGMPGMSTLAALVPNLSYDGALKILEAMMNEIEKDLPELTYYNMKGQISGVAVREMMADAVDRVAEARQNFESALVIANKHALTLGIKHEIFNDIGLYENGDFDHSFLERDILPMTVAERAAVLKILTDTKMPILAAMVIADYPKEMIATVKKEMEVIAKQEESRLKTLVADSTESDTNPDGTSKGIAPASKAAGGQLDVKTTVSDKTAAPIKANG